MCRTAFQRARVSIKVCLILQMSCWILLYTIRHIGFNQAGNVKVNQEAGKSKDGEGVTKVSTRRVGMTKKLEQTGAALRRY